mmetsp:Transcript_11700/g.36084  ORF Transcript_11700/g.36084 Transcript_11700/m.36084 type:complete len:96 (-) Transcript_11700:77-364(-)
MPLHAARALALWAAATLLATFADAQPRRGPPSGSIKEDKSTFFGKEGDQSGAGDFAPHTKMVMIACALLLVAYGLFQILSEKVVVEQKSSSKKKK